MIVNEKNRPRVVVTGIGAQSPLGAVDSYWENLKSGISGIRRTSLYDPQNLEVQVAAEVDFDPTDFIDRKNARTSGLDLSALCANSAPANSALALV